MQRLQGAVVGDFGVGKTSMLYAMVGKPVPDHHVPTLLESYCVDVPVGGGDKVNGKLSIPESYMYKSK